MAQSTYSRVSPPTSKLIICYCTISHEYRLVEIDEKCVFWLLLKCVFNSSKKNVTVFKNLYKIEYSLQCHGNPDDDTTSSDEDDDNDDDNDDDDQDSQSVVESHGEAPTTSNQNNEPEPMDEDVEPGWTVVRTRRRK